MDFFNEEKILISLHPVLRTLSKQNAVVTKIGEMETLLNNPLIYTIENVHKQTKIAYLIKFSRDITLGAIKILISAGLAKYLTKDLMHPYKSRICITNDGFLALKNQKYRREIAKKMLKAAKEVKSFAK